MPDLHRWFPFLGWPRPDVTLMRGEASASLTVAVVMIPQSVAYAALARCNRHRQFLHDLLARTRLVQTPPPPRRQP